MTNIDDAHQRNRFGFSKLNLLAVGIGVGLGVAINLCSGLFVFPLPATDSIAFIPAAINFHCGHGLINPVWDGSSTFDPDHFRFIYHGPLFPIVTSWLMPTQDARGAFVAVALLRIATLLVLGLLMIYASRNFWHRHTLLVPLLLFTMIMAEAGMRLPTVGRPEALSTLLLLIAFAAAWLLRPMAGTALAAGMIGLTGAAQPVGAAFGLLMLIGWIAVRFEVRLALIAITGAVVLSLGVTLACLSVSPHGLNDSVRGILAHGSVQADRVGGGGLLRYTLFWWDRTFFGPAFVLAFFSSVLLMWRYHKKVASPLIAWSALILLAWGFVYKGFLAPPITYNLSQFQPVAYLLLLLAAASIRMENVKTLSTVLITTWLAIAPSLLVYLKTGTEYYWMRASGTTYSTTSFALSQHIDDEELIYVDSATWCLVDDYRRSRQLPSDWRKSLDKLKGPSCVLISSNLTLPDPANDRMEVIVDLRAKQRPVLMGAPVTKFDSGYSCQLMACDAADEIAVKADTEAEQ